MYSGMGNGFWGIDKGYLDFVYINLFSKDYVLVIFIYSNVVF